MEIHSSEELISAGQKVTLATINTPNRIYAHCTRLRDYITQQF